MANNQSWEYYMQPYSDTKYPLYWIAGVANPAALVNQPLVANQLWLIPFNLMRDVTLDKIGISVFALGGEGAKVRLGIYENNASNDNYPKALSKDAGELDVGPGSGTGARFLTNVNHSLAADNRWWAALIPNAAPTVKAAPDHSLIFWGATAEAGTALTSPTAVRLAQNYAALPDPAPVSAGTGDLLVTDSVPAIILGFSGVT